MKKLHIICLNIEQEILRDFYLSESVSKIHRENTLDALFIPDCLEYPLLKKYCSGNKKAPIELVNLENIYSDIAMSHFAQINSYLKSRNPINDIAFVPLVNENINFLRIHFQESGLEIEIQNTFKENSLTV